MKVVLSFLLLFFSFIVCAQSNKIDSLKQALKNANHDTTKLIALNDIAKEFEKKQSDSSLSNYTKSKEFAEKLVAKYTKTSKEYKSAMFSLGKSLSSMSFINNKKGKVAVSIELYNKSLKVFEEINDKSSASNVLNSLGHLYKDIGEIDKAIDYHKKCLIIRQEIKEKGGIASTLNNLGNIYRNQGKIADALEAFNSSLKIREELADKQGIAKSLNNIGIVHDSQGEFQKAIGFYSRSLKISREINDKKSISQTLGNLGITHNNF